MRMPIGSRLILAQDEVVTMVSSGILTITIGEATLTKEQAFICRHIEPKAAEFITAVSSSGYEFQCVSLDSEWEFEVNYAPPELDEK